MRPYYRFWVARRGSYASGSAGLPDAQLDEIAVYYDFLELQPLATTSS